MTHVYICRHGNTFDKGDTVTRVGARTDLRLSSSGIRQAEELAGHLSSVKFDKIYCSPLKRTKQTAMAILEKQQSSPEIIFAPFLKEIDYGPDENMPEEAVVERIGQDALNLWEESAIPPKGWLLDPAEIKREWKKFFESLSEIQADNTLVMTSNGTARFVFDIADELPADAPRKLRTASYGIIKVTNNNELIMSSWNVRP